MAVIVVISNGSRSPAAVRRPPCVGKALDR